MNSTCLKQFWWSDYLFLCYEYGMVISVYGMVIAMVCYEWYGMVWYMVWYGMNGMVYGMVWMVWYMVWYEWYGMIWLYHSVVCDMVWMVWYDVAIPWYGMVMVWMVWYSNGMNGMVWYGHTMAWYMVWYDSTSGIISPIWTCKIRRFWQSCRLVELWNKWLTHCSYVPTASPGLLPHRWMLVAFLLISVSDQLSRGQNFDWN